MTDQNLRLRPLAPADAVALRDAFLAGDFTVPAICARLELPGMHEFNSRRDGRTIHVELESALDAWIRLFLDVEPTPLAVIGPLIGAATVDHLLAAGLLELVDDATIQSTVMLYPLDGLWLASDVAASMRPGVPDLDDVVYPAVTANTRRFLDGLPSVITGDFLELCGGTGAAALKAARSGARAWTTDITERSTMFAAFNASLNGLAGCTAIAGDLYDAVPGLQFDRIAAHPPYVATPNSRVIFRDGGEDGEVVTRGIVSGLPGALRPGGRCYLTCMVTDRSDQPMEQRLREWLGPTHEEFDVHLFVRTAFTPTEYYGMVAADGAMSVEQRDEWIAYFARLGVVNMLYSWMVIERHASVRPPITRRRIRVSDAPQDEIESILTWETRFEDPAARGLTCAARPQLHPDVRLGAVLRADGGSWRPETTALESPNPFRAHVDLPSVLTGTVARMDGTRTAAELRAEGLRLGEFHEASTEDDVLDLIRQLLASGMVRIASA